MPRISAPTVAEHRDRQLELLIDAARDLVREGGIDALTLASLAKRAGRSRASLYVYFGSTRDLHVTIAEHAIATWAHGVVRTSAAAPTPAARLERFIAAQVTAAPDPVLDAALRVAASPLDDDDRRRILGAQVPLLEELLDILAALGIEPPDRAAFLVQGAIATAHDQLASGAAEAVVLDDTVRFIEAGLGAIAGTPASPTRGTGARSRPVRAGAGRDLAAGDVAGTLAFSVSPSLPLLFASVVRDTTAVPGHRSYPPAGDPAAVVAGRVRAVAGRRRARLAVVGLLAWAAIAFVAGVAAPGAPVVHVALGLGLVVLAAAAVPVVGRTRMVRGLATVTAVGAATTSAVVVIGGAERWTGALHVAFAIGLLGGLFHLARVAWHARPVGDVQPSSA